jgi:hypothetical protein
MATVAFQGTTWVHPGAARAAADPNNPPFSGQVVYVRLCEDAQHHLFSAVSGGRLPD